MPASLDLISRTAELVEIPSESHHETAIAEEVSKRLRAVDWLKVERVGDNVIARSNLGHKQRLVLAGHLDTVPANGNQTPKISGDTIAGLGAADMKGGLAVMIALAESLDAKELAVDLTFVFYVAEEVARVHSGLLQIDAKAPELLRGDAAVLGEPTGARIEAGCQGVIKVKVSLGGHRAHTARPWRGVNAVHRLGPLLDGIANHKTRRPVIDECEYREALQVVSVSGGVAGNVVPDQVEARINHRFAPDRDVDSAGAYVKEIVEPFLSEEFGDTFEVFDSSPACPPGLDHPLLAGLRDATGAPPRAKLGWTDVAFFAERDIPAVNFGPGDSELAHTAGEWVSKEDLETVYSALRHLLGRSGSPR